MGLVFLRRARFFFRLPYLRELKRRIDNGVGGEIEMREFVRAAKMPAKGKTIDKNSISLQYEEALVRVGLERPERMKSQQEKGSITVAGRVRYG